ncbi:Respiratory complex assembly protein [Schizosaccharomyces pombe]
MFLRYFHCAVPRAISQRALKPMDIPFLRMFSVYNSADSIECYIEPIDNTSFFLHPFKKIRFWWRYLFYGWWNLKKNQFLIKRTFPDRDFSIAEIIQNALKLHSGVNKALANHDLQQLEELCTLRTAQILKQQALNQPKCIWKLEKHISKPKLLNLSRAQADLKGEEFFVQAVVRLHTLQSLRTDKGSPKIEKPDIENVVIQQRSWTSPIRWQLWGSVPSTPVNTVRKTLPDGQVTFVAKPSKKSFLKQLFSGKE